MSHLEAAAAIEAFIARKGITRCPAACVTRTTAIPSEADRRALAAYRDRQEAARMAKIARRQAA